MKDAALVVREVLVVQACTYARTPAAWREAVIHAFGRDPRDHAMVELNSQFYLSLKMILRLGRDRALFDRAAPNTYGQQLSDEQRAFRVW